MRRITYPFFATYATSCVFAKSTTSLSDVSVVFTPSGIVFNPPATLTLLLRGELSEEELNALKAYHHHNGMVTEISVAIVDGKKEWKITVKIPGFSRYSLETDEGYDPVDDEGW